MKDETTRTRGRGKVRALLAGGLVLGVGATVVLAAWNDSEFGTGTFTAGAFNMQGSTNGTTFTDHAAAPGATLPFTLSPDNLAPGDTVYAPFAVRLAANTSTGATVTVNGATAGGTSIANLSYQLLQTTSFGCDASTTGTDLVAAGTALDGTLSGVTFNLDAGSPTTDPGDPVFLCFKVTAGAGLVQGQSGTATWELSAASTS